MDDDNDRTVVRSSHTHRPQAPRDFGAQTQGVNGLPVGTRLGEFEITGLVGEGGFGIVYLAYDHSLDRQVALKEYMPAGMASRTQALQVTVRSRHYVDTFTMGLKSFVNEARMLARFDSPSLVKVYRFWEDNGTAYMVMPYYDGVTLKQALTDRLVVPDEEWLRRLLTNLLDAIDTIHQVQCYHRDIAPDNILILKDGRPLLLDFGAARRVIGDLTQGLTVILKPGFAPIEQYADIPGLKQGPWTDIYALAAVVYFAITGKTPPPSVARIVNDEMLPAREAGRGRYSEHFLGVIDRALAVKPENRIGSVAELRDALGLQAGISRTMPGLGARAPAGGASPSPWPGTQSPRRTGTGKTAQDDDWHKTMVSDQRQMPPRKRSKVGAILGTLVVLAGVGGGVAGYRWMTGAGNQETPTAERPAAATDEVQSSGSTEGAGTSASGPGPGTPPPPAADASPPPPAAPPATPPAAITPAPAPPPPVALNTEKPAPEPRQAKPLPPAPAAPTTAPAAPAAPGLSAEDELWRAATEKDTRSAYEAYLKKYPRGKHAQAARVMIDSTAPKLTQAEPAPAAPTPPVKEDKPAPPASKSPDTATAMNNATAPSAPKPEAKPPAPEPERRPAQTSVNPAGTPSVAPPAPPPAPAPAAPPPPVTLRTPGPDPSTEAKKEAPKPETPPPPPAGTQKTIKLAGQTMTGNFTADPATGIVSGSGHIVWDNGDRYEGRLVKGSKEGRGQFTWANGQRYTGDWAGDVPNGKGVLRFANGNRYEGEVRNGEPHGQGTIRFPSGDVYTGGWMKGKHHGQGKYTWANGTYWEGEFRDGAKTENGKTVFADGRVQMGTTASAEAGGAQQNTSGSTTER
ncbi:protein kinase domain-containing protein [Noviherbaspirillum sp.]|uniref:protein kinase domain-containing protein n=1 Tax=Noviherbaspirillum sp. TaxID=1926288 RepID=UPI002D3FCB37|nr:protein kinase [Noviherbaspirillum sp.]HZW19937.1 protein kinase [Noviherbaspirillum sp.]